MQSADVDIELIRDEVARTLADLDPASSTRRLLDEEGEFDRRLWSTVSKLGWLGVDLPEISGGLGLDLAARCAVAEEIGRVVAAIPYAVSTCAMASLVAAGSPEQLALLEPGIAGEMIFTVALFERGEAGVPSHPITVFEDGRVTGAKVAVPAGAFAHQALVLCAGGKLALVDLDQSQVERRVANTVENSRGYADLKFDRAPASLVAGEGLHESLLDELALVSAFEQIGGAQACLTQTRDYSLLRRAFGQPIGAFQAVKHGLADFYVLVQIARGNGLSALQALPEELRLAAACARLSAIRAYDHCAQEAIQLHGAIGTTWEAVQHLHLRRSRCLAQEWGGAAFWRDRLLSAALRLEGTAS